MGMHKDFPSSPFVNVAPEVRWLPADETLRESSYGKLIPPLVHNIRKELHKWRKLQYAGASETSKALLCWWFHTEHMLPSNGTLNRFCYYFAQQEAVETIIWLYEVAGVREKAQLIRFDSSGEVSLNMLPEDWLRFVIKMATGSGKTKVISLIITWCFFHKRYEADSALAANFLLIAPNIIVLDRLRADFDGLKIFFIDPILPDNGYDGRNWRDDFQLSLHIQDDLSAVRKSGNIFLTNIHRVYIGNEQEPSIDDDDTMDYFLGKRPVGKTNDSKLDLGLIVREIDELIVINDEAHHVHDEKMAWFKSIEDIHNRLKQKGTRLALQIDVTATPKHNNGAIFAQTVCDYPLVEAIAQNVVKHPVLPDAASRAKLMEKASLRYTEKYADYIALGVEEWRKAYIEHEKMGKKAVLFIMTDDTQNCDDVAEYLKNTFAEFQEKNSVLVIHTKNNGEISEASTGKKKEELDALRKQANGIDNWESPCKVIVSVLVLKEGWDVKNVCTIVGLRAYAAKSNILPEQTLGRGLRRMYPLATGVTEYVSVLGTAAFMDFVESIQTEGVEFEHRPMGIGGGAKTPLIIEVDNKNHYKDIDLLDIAIPRLSARMTREYKNLELIETSTLAHKKITYQTFEEEEQREIIFKDIVTDEKTHSTILANVYFTDASSVIGYFTQKIMHDLRLFGGYDMLYGKIKEFIREHLFICAVDLTNLNTLRNLSEPEVANTIIVTMKQVINNNTVVDKGSTEIRDYIRLRNTRPFVTQDQAKLIPQKSLFNAIVGDNHFELLFAEFLEQSQDVIAYAKNYFAVHFNLDYINANGDISNYYPDFIVKTSNNKIWIVETKGLEDLNVPCKMARLKQWCADVNTLQIEQAFGFLFVDEKTFKELRANDFATAVKVFGKYQ